MMKHKAKMKLARKLRSKLEAKRGVPIFLTDNWLNRKYAIQLAIENRNLKRLEKKLRRIEARVMKNSPL